MRYRLPHFVLTLAVLTLSLCAPLVSAAADPGVGIFPLATLRHQPIERSLPECRYPRLITEAPSGTTFLTTSTVREVRREFLSSDLAAPSDLTNLTAVTDSSDFVDLFETLSQTFERLGYSAKASLITIESPIANAFVRRGKEVVITTTLLSRIRGRSEMAFILAHELAHVAFSHDSKGGIDAEVAADTLALRVVTALSFDPCSGSSVLERLGKPSEVTLASLKPRLNALHNKTFDLCG